MTKTIVGVMTTRDNKGDDSCNELGIRRHAERLEADLGTDRAIAVLEQVTRAIAARRAPSPTVIIKATGK